MAEQTTHTLPLREKVPSSDKWHIEDIFADDNAFLAALSACRTHINALSEFKNHLGDSAETLCHYLTEKEKVLVDWTVFTAMPDIVRMKILLIRIIRIYEAR